MKTNWTLIIFSILILGGLLTSCSSERNFSKRKYLPGLFRDPIGNKEMISQDSHGKTVLPKSDSASKKSAIPFVKTEPATASQNSLIHTETQTNLPITQPVQKTKQKVPDETKTRQDSPDETARIKWAWIAAWIALALLLTGIIFMFFSSLIAYVSIAVLLAIIFAITGMIIARKVRKNHLPDEAYEGKNKIIFARIVGITAIMLTALYLAILAMVIIALYRWQ